MGDRLHLAGQLGSQPAALHAHHQALQAEAALQVHLRGVETHSGQGRVTQLAGQLAGQLLRQQKRRASRSGGTASVRSRIAFPLPVSFPYDVGIRVYYYYYYYYYYYFQRAKCCPGRPF